MADAVGLREVAEGSPAWCAFWCSFDPSAAIHNPSAAASVFGQTLGMAISVEGPSVDVGGLAELEPLWGELHRWHLRVATYGPLVNDVRLSWQRRRSMYRDLVARGAAYFVARDSDAQAIGYSFVVTDDTADDTFAGAGTVEVVSLIVSEQRRGAGIGRALLHAVDEYALGRGCDVVKVAVMAGNDRAQRFYARGGFRDGEIVLYRRLAASSEDSTSPR